MSGYQLLANAIIAQAAEDYRTALQDKSYGEQNILERFFNSAWFSTLTRVNGEYLMRKLREEVRSGHDLSRSRGHYLCSF